MTVILGGVYCLASLFALAQMGGGWLMLGIVIPPLNIVTPLLYWGVMGELPGALVAVWVLTLVAIFTEMSEETA